MPIEKLRERAPETRVHEAAEARAEPSREVRGEPQVGIERLSDANSYTTTGERLLAEMPPVLVKYLHPAAPSKLALPLRTGRMAPIAVITDLLTAAPGDIAGKTQQILDAQDKNGAWKDHAKRRHANYSASILNHTALAMTLHSGALGTHPELQDKVRSALRLSQAKLEAPPGQPAGPVREVIAERLPTAVLRGAEPMVRALHETVLGSTELGPGHRAPIATIMAALTATHVTAEIRARAEHLLASQTADGGWPSATSVAATHEASVLNHTALAALLKSGAFANEPAVLAHLETSLLLSWTHLTGKLQDPRKMLEALPSSVLRGTDAMVGGLHRAVIEMPKAKPPREEPLPKRDGPEIRQGRTQAIAAMKDAAWIPGDKAHLREQALHILAEQTADGSWKDRPEHMRGTQNASVLNHSALVSLLKSEAFAGDAEMTTRLELALMLSWTNLNDGKMQAPSALLDPLPASVLNRTEPVAKRFHLAASGPKGELLAALNEALAAHTVSPNGAPLPPSTAALVAQAVTAVAVSGAILQSEEAARLFHEAMRQPTTRTALEFVAATAAAHLFSQVNEAFFHNHLQHATPATRQWWKKWAPQVVREALDRALKSHKGMHHGGTFQEDHVTQYKNAEQEQALHDNLWEAGDQEIIGARLGLTVKALNTLKFFAPTSPILIAAIAEGYHLGLGWGALGGLVTGLMSTPIMIKYFHPAMHLTAEERKTESAPVRAYYETELGQQSLVDHLVHHEDEDATVNNNVLPGDLGDKMLRTYRAPTDKHFDEARRLGMIR